jgi:hypothetical protein
MYFTACSIALIRVSEEYKLWSSLLHNRPLPPVTSPFYSPWRFDLKYPQFMFFPYGEGQSFTPLK